jgi:hypothetical protein
MFGFDIDWTSILITIGITVFFILMIAFIYLIQNMNHIKENWVKYRCKPYVLPFASLFGKDTEQNFQYCLMHSQTSMMGYLFEPFQYMFSLVTSITGDLVSGVDGLRSMSSTVRGGFTGIVGGIFNKINNVTSEIIVMFTRIRDILARLIGTMVILVNTTNAGISTGESVMNGPIGQVIDYFCFHPNTHIKLSDKTTKPISDISIGDILEDGSVVTSTMIFTSESAQMYDVSGIIVSGNHLFRDPTDNTWKPVEFSSIASRINYYDPYLYCINTSTHTIKIDGITFRDFEETSDKEIIKQIQKLTYDEKKLNYWKNYSNSAITGTYETGLFHNTLIIMNDRTTKPISEIQIGDLLVDNNIVVGKIKHIVDEPITKVDDVFMMKDTLVVADGLPDYIRPRNMIDKSIDYEGGVMYQLLTTKSVFTVKCPNGRIMKVADDNETYDTNINTYREELILNKLNS